jgi:hypothetical protein
MVASHSQPKAISGSLVGTPMKYVPTANSTVQTDMPMIRRRRRSSGVAGGMRSGVSVDVITDQ